MLPDQFQEGFVHQSGALKGVIGSFLAQIAPCQAMEFAVDQWSQLLERLLIPVPPVGQQTGDFVLGRHDSVIMPRLELFAAWYARYAIRRSP